MNQQFIQNVLDVRGEEGKKWLERIPDIIVQCEKRWNISVSDPFTLSYNYVAPAKKATGEDVVLKIGFPQDNEFLSEFAGLTHFKGEGAVKIIDDDIKNGVMLLEKITPGVVLHEVGSDEEQTKIGCRVIKKLHKPAPADTRLIDLSRWRSAYKWYKEKYDLVTGPIPQDVFLLAESLDTKHFSHPLEKPMLIHGDFHHDNILSSQRDEWLVIDTKGVIGNPIYDIVVFLYNPMPKLNVMPEDVLYSLITKRLDIIQEELGFERSLLIEWGISKAILSSLWTIEFHSEGWEYGVRFAQMLRSMSNTSFKS